MIASPSSAPKARLKRNLIIFVNMTYLQHFFAPIKSSAATNPKREMPKPAKNPKPHICGLVRSLAWTVTS